MKHKSNRIISILVKERENVEFGRMECLGVNCNEKFEVLVHLVGFFKCLKVTRSAQHNPTRFQNTNLVSMA